MYQLDIFEIFNVSREQVLNIIDVCKQRCQVISHLSKLFCEQIRNMDVKQMETWRLLQKLRMQDSIDSLIILAWRS